MRGDQLSPEWRGKVERAVAENPIWQVVTPAQLEEARQYLACGLALRHVALLLDVSRQDLDLALWRSTGAPR